MAEAFRHCGQREMLDQDLLDLQQLPPPSASYLCCTRAQVPRHVPRPADVAVSVVTVAMAVMAVVRMLVLVPSVWLLVMLNRNVPDAIQADGL